MTLPPTSCQLSTWKAPLLKTRSWHWDQNQINICSSWAAYSAPETMVEEKHPNLRGNALNLTALFGSTYLCKSAFSRFNIIKTKYRSAITDSHLAACLRLATGCYTPDYEKLAASSQCQVFHWVRKWFHCFKLRDSPVLLYIWFNFLFGSYRGNCLSNRLVRVWERDCDARYSGCVAARKCFVKLVTAEG